MAGNTTVVGKALYLEMRHGSNTTQMILTPEAITSGGKVVPMTCYRRHINPSQPRRSWKAIASSFASERDLTTNTLFQLETPHALATFQDRVIFTDSLFSQLISRGYQVFKQPIAIEVSIDDLDDIRMGKTPYKILGRITRCRRTLGFGESLFA